MLFQSFKRSMVGMNRNNVLTVVRLAAGLACWLIVYKLYGYYIDPLLADVLPETLRLILKSMVVPYTVALGAFYLVVRGMPATYSVQGSIRPGPALIAKAFAVQTGFAMPVMFIVNAIVVLVLKMSTPALTAEDLFGNPWFYLILLLVFNPIMEEVLFRKLILGRLTCLGVKPAIIWSAVFFAVPHIISQGPAQMLYTFVLGLVWAYVTLKTGKLWPAVILHSLSNIYGAYLPIILTSIHPALSAVFVLLTIGIFVPAAVLCVIIPGGKR